MDKINEKVQGQSISLMKQVCHYITDSIAIDEEVEGFNYFDAPTELMTELDNNNELRDDIAGSVECYLERLGKKVSVDVNVDETSDGELMIVVEWATQD